MITLILVFTILIPILVTSSSEINFKETNSKETNINYPSQFEFSFPLSISPDWTAECNQAYARFSCSVSKAGDVNGDGYDDLIISAAYYDNGETDEGRVFVYYGSVNGLPSTPSWTAESNQGGASCYSAATAGDVNGDGYSDIIAGAQFYDNGQIDEGRVYAYYGSSSGLPSVANWTAESNQAGAAYGIMVSTAGDVNGDGYSDVIVGAQFYDNGQTDEGRAYVYYGSASGLSDTANWTAECEQNYSYFGISVSTAGDVNGDGYADVIVGAPYFSNGEASEGRAYVYYGSSTGLSNIANWTAESDQAYSLFGYSVSTAGDVNGDSYTDVILGAYLYDLGETDEGRAYVYYGSSSGLSSTPNWTAESNQINARFGVAVSTADDVNGDGHSDVIVGAYRYDNPQIDEGKAYIYYGSPTGVSSEANWTTEINQTGARFGYSVSTAGDVNEDGYSDAIIGAVNYDNGELDEGGAFIYYGGSEIKILTSTVLIQGFYDANLNTMIQDTIRVFLRNSSSPYEIIDSSKTHLNSSGTGTFSFSNASNGINYYIHIKHRNSVETWSSSGQSFISSMLTYNFSSSNTQAYGSNMIEVDNSPIAFAIYSGDVNQDGTADATDLSMIDNDAYNFITGYVNTDLTGNNVTDASDAAIADNNAFNFVSLVIP